MITRTDLYVGSPEDVERAINQTENNGWKVRQLVLTFQSSSEPNYIEMFVVLEMETS